MWRPNTTEVISSIMTKGEMGIDIHLQMWKKLTFDLENFLSFGYGKSNQNWFTECVSSTMTKVEIAKDIHVKFFDIWCEKRFAMQQSIQ